MEGQSGTRVELPCIASHSRLAVVTFQWRKNGKSVVNSSNTRLTNVDNGMILTLDSVSPSNNGRYQCLVSTTVNSVRAPQVKATIYFTVTGTNPYLS